jgi:hypothetical protein
VLSKRLVPIGGRYMIGTWFVWFRVRVDLVSMHFLERCIHTTSVVTF